VHAAPTPHQIRNPKTEIRNKFETTNAKEEARKKKLRARGGPMLAGASLPLVCCFFAVIGCFEFVSYFVLRVSCFCF